jgi:hypothetical protein
MAYNQSNALVLVFGAVGQPLTTRFMVPNAGATSVAEVAQILGVATRLVRMSVVSRVAPGGAFDDTYTVNLDGVASAATVTISATATEGDYTGAVAVGAAVAISVEFTSTSVATRDAYVTLILQVQE